MISQIDGQPGYSHKYIRNGESAEYFYPKARADWCREHRREAEKINRNLRCYWSKASALATPIIEKRLGPCPETIITIYEDRQ